MKRMFLNMTIGLGILAIAAQQVWAQNCAPRKAVVERLSETYGETRRGIGIARQGAVMEVYASDRTGSWTITVTLPDGMTCLIASGRSFEVLAETLPPNI
ncbi:hypothetical protein RA28_01760 [Ruegeria sp. ANG-S4]|uniref:hypothetical protein n=1 Tax=Ruegeria sp. ANG-S4 TaxID=1577904 RepID=UPI00057D015A|nr:hypothetical protein [Ruegeria sp. ANG-S4]KIC46538.1 hypothetical protein RA28_01760 [Ruegeria sp. ANG-S4]